MQKKLSLVLALSLVFGSVSATAALADDNTTTSTSTTTTTTTAAVTTIVSIPDQIKTFAELKALFDVKDKPVDLKAVKDLYIAKIQGDVKLIDKTISQEYAPKIDFLINQTLDTAIEGKLNVGQAKQAIDKGLQWYFYFKIKDILSKQVKPALDKKDTATAVAELDKAVQIYTAIIQPTAIKRDTYFKDFNLKLQEVLDNTAIKGLQEAVQKNDIVNYNINRQILDKTIIKLYILANLTYAIEIPKKAEADKPAAITEGYFFFMPVYTYLAGGSREDADYIRKAFESGKPENIKLQEIKDAYMNTLIAKTSEYVKKSIDNINNGKAADAIVPAIEGAMFINATEIFIKDKFGSEVYNELNDYAQKFFVAVKAADGKTAELNGFKALQILSKYHGVQLKVNSDTVQVHGIDTKIDAPAFVNAQTARTLVPLRAVAEALGIEVSFDEATRTVKLVKGQTTTEIVIGSKEIKQNGKALEVKLEQEALIQQNRTFIPLRAVAELFGNKVFYNEGNIVIVK